MKTILITGANRLDGIGFNAASRLVAQGHRVIITSRTKESADEALLKLGSGAGVIALDVTKPDSIEAFAREVQSLTDHLDVLINNAGLLLDFTSSIFEIDGPLLQQTFAVNSIAPVLIAQKLLPLLKKSSEPRIINVSSGAGQLSDNELTTWAPAYSASKAALNALTQQLAAALPTFAVNAMCPGWCSTRMGGKNAPKTPAEGADTMVWLAEEAPQSLTGKFIRERKEIVW